MAGALLTTCGVGAPAAEPTISEGDRAYGAQQHVQLLAEFGGAYAGDEAGYVRAVGERMADAAEVGGQCTFTLVNSDVVNAFAVPGCYIYVTRGLLAVVTSEAELASVLGHEVGHVVARHPQRQEKRSLWRRLGVIAASLTGSERLTRLAGQAAQYFGLRYSRRQEYEADDLGVVYLRQAGYDVFAAAEMLGDLQRHETFMNDTASRDAARSVPEWALSHPLTQHRIDRARETAQKTGLKDDALPENAQAYLTQVDGLLYGDDPAQGFVIGRRFAHPVMRIGFEAPSGFTLTNSPQAIRLSGPEGVSGEFAGGAMPQGSLNAYVEALISQIVGKATAQVGQAAVTRVNGLPAIFVEVRVAVQGASVPISVAAYDGGDGQAYHFIVASPPTNSQAAEVLALLRSFRRLSPQEAATLRPRFVRTIRVPANASPDRLIGLMVDPAPRQLFELLNGRRLDAPFESGGLVKIVTYADGRR